MSKTKIHSVSPSEINICPHCTNYIRKTLQGRVIYEGCKKDTITLNVDKCMYFDKKWSTRIRELLKLMGD